MRTPPGRIFRLFGVVCVGLGLGAAARAQAPATPAAPATTQASPTTVTARRVVDPAAPILPAEVVTAMQEGQYKVASAALERLAAGSKNADELAYYAWIQGIAGRLDGRSADAVALLRNEIRTRPSSRWASKIRFELAALELAAGRYSAAEEIARRETESLLAGTRKDRLAEVYYAYARRLLRPDDPVSRPDPVGAHALLVQGRELAKGEALRAKLLFEQARASQTAGGPNLANAANEFLAYTREYKTGEDRADAFFHLGEVQLWMGQPLQARLTWTDLAADLTKPPLSAHPRAADLRAKSLYLIGNTYGMPNPPDDTQLNLAIAARKKYLAAYPKHVWAVRAAYEIGIAYSGRGKSEQAIEAFREFIKGTGFEAVDDEARRDLAEQSMFATYQIGAILFLQGKYDQATEAYKAYLAKYPNGPQSAEAQRSILEAQLATAADKLNRGLYAEARSAWTAFVAQNPLDPRAPQLLFQIGETFLTEKKYDEAIAAWQPLLGKFPGSEPAAHAEFAVASIYEVEKGRPAEAIERFRKIGVDPWRTQALLRVAVMESKVLQVVTPRIFRSGETAHLKITTRNLENLTFTAYKLNAEAYFRKKHAIGRVESLDVGLVAPDAEWTVPVKDYGKYKPIETTYDLKVEVPGVYVVKVTDEKTLQATTLVVGSDVDAIMKASKDQILIFAQDAKTGKGRPNARVLISDGATVVMEKKTGPDGVLLTNWEKPRQPNTHYHYLILDGKDSAGSELALDGNIAQGLSARAYLYTDRPAYRPGDSVKLRGIVREIADGQYASPADQPYRLEVYDARGRMIVAKGVALSKFGTFNDSLELDSAAPVGNYRVRVFQPGRSDFGSNFEVQAYRLESMDLAFDLPRTVYFRGETIKGEVVAKYQYGAPVANRAIQVVLPDGRTLSGTTDAAGKYKVEFPTEGFAEEQTLTLVARLPQDNVGVAANVTLAVRAFRIDLATNRTVYLDGEGFQLKATTLDAQGEPISEELKVTVLKQVTSQGRTAEVEVSKATLTTDKKTGSGALSLKVDDKEGGTFIVRASGVDRFGNPVFVDRALTISGSKDETKLRLLAERQTFKVGETAKVVLHSRAKAGVALLAWEADRVLSYRLVDVKEGENAVTWLVEGNQFPNFTLTAGRMVDARFDTAALDVKVERDLRVSIAPVKPTVGPGDEVELEVTTVDQTGKPVAAELSVALIDRSLLRLFGDRAPEVGTFFYSQTRTGSFITTSSNTFSYSPSTVPVEEAVVEEAARALAMAADESKLHVARESAQSQVADASRKDNEDPRFAVQLNVPPAAAPAPVMATPAAPGQPMSMGYAANSRMMMGRMSGPSGGMGGMGGGGGMPGLATGEPQAGKPMAKSKAEFDAPSNRPRSSYRRKEGKLDAAADRSAEPRERFVETAYWNPSVVTGADGKTIVKFKAPNAMSAYRFTARGTTGSDTLVGQATADLVVKKDFFVDLKTPSLLTQGDRPRFIGQVHHMGVTGKTEVKLTTYAGGKQNVALRNVDLKNDGVTEIAFEPFDVPDGDVVRLTLQATSGEKTDELVVEIPIKPWGVQAIASASGSSSDGATVFVSLPAGRVYESPEMLVVVSPTVRRMLIELALGRDAYILPARFERCIFPPTNNTIADRAGELLGLTSVLAHLAKVKADMPPEAARLSGRAREIVSELVTLQNDDGSWPWIAPRQFQNGAGDPLTSARVSFALASASSVGLATDAGVVDRSINYLNAQFGRTNAADMETRAAILHALATHKRASFELANGLNRIRQGLNDVSLAYLALTMHELDRPGLANEILDLLAGRAKSEGTAPGKPARKYWEGANQHWHGTVETTALASLAYAKARPAAPELAASADWLMAHRAGTGWNPTKAKGPALAALSTYHAASQAADDRYKLVVTVNGEVVHTATVEGSTEGKAIVVPRKFLKPTEANRVKFDIEGRGNFGYAVTMTGFTRDFGPDQDTNGKLYYVDNRIYLHANPELDGRTLPTGFSTVVNPVGFANKVTQVGLGGRARVQLQVHRFDRGDRPAWERPAIVVEETLPAGATLIEGSVKAGTASYEVVDNTLTFHFAPNDYPGTIEYEVFGFLPGQYRALPTRVRDAYDPGKYHLGSPGDLRVLAPGEPETDPYKATPDELFARGKAHFDAGRLTDAAGPLEEVSAGYTLRDDVLKQVARMLLTIHIRDYQPRKLIQDFEVLKEKAPDVVIPFEEITVIGRAYRDINEHERAYLVWRAITEASYLEDARVGEVLRQRGKSLDSVAYLVDLWREYPNSASIESDFFGLAQTLADRASKAFTDPALRKEMADAGVTRAELLLQSIRMNQIMLTLSPKNPMADEVSLALAGAFLELEDYETLVKLSDRFAKLYPKSQYLDSFQFSEALGNFNLGKYDQAIEMAEKISKATYKDANGVDQPSPNKWQAVYILGQIYDARRNPAKALGYYQEVADKFTDAAGAVLSLTRKDLKVPEISVVRLDKAGAKVGLGSVPPAATTKPEVKLDYRNIAEADVKVYPVDLMRLYLTRRNLDAVAGIDLAGITPLYESTVKLGDGNDFAEKIKTIDLPLTKEGAYLVMIRGGDLYASGIVLVSPLEVEVLEEAASGRVRVEVRDAKTKQAVSKVQVKVIGSENPAFISGRTDLRGVFVAEGVRGQVTAVARRDAAQYAFYRGTSRVGDVPPQAPARGRRMPQEANAPADAQSLDNNLKSLNTGNQMRQTEKLYQRLNTKGGQGGVISSDAY